MGEKRIFVGREDELEQFAKVLERPGGESVLVVGQRGMGKTWLVSKMAQIAQKHPELKCGAVRYEVTPTDSVDSTMALMMDNAFEAARVEEGSFDGTARGVQQWKALLNIIKVGDLVMSLRRDPAKNTREQFLERLRLISGRMPDNGRAVFIIDPEKYMQEKSDQSWAMVGKDLPEKIKFVFAQRPEDMLVESETIDELDNVVRIPEKRLGVLEKKAIDKLLKSRAKEVGYTVKQLEKALSRYKGHPYAIGAALDLLEVGTKLEELPKKPEPTKFAEVQWKKVCSSGDGAIELFEAYAVLEVGVLDDVVEAVSGLKSSRRRKLLANKYLGGLLREEGYGKRIYHAILRDYIVRQIGEGEKKKYHSRAVDVYRERLHKDVKPDALSATRLAEHVLAAEGEEAFVLAVLNETGEVLKNLGLLSSVESSLLRASEMVKEGSAEEAAALGNLGLIYGKRGNLDKAEQMHLKSLEIEEKLGRLEGIASDYGNLGLIYQRRGNLDKAEEMYNRVLEIEEKLGRPDSIANAYGNLGVIYGARGDLDKAEEMHKKSLEIEKKLGRLEGMASEYNNLGPIYQKRGELDKAEEMHLKSLEIHEKLEHREGMASNYGNLGWVYKKRGDIKTAREYWAKAVELFKKIGMPHMVEKVQGWIDGLRK